MQNTLPKIAILHSAIVDANRPDEQDTLVQVAEIQRTLDALGYVTTTLPFGEIAQVDQALRQSQVDVVFNLVESIQGKSELLHFPALYLESIPLPFTGSSSSALFLTTHKVLAKVMMRSLGIPTAPWYYPYAEIGAQYEALPGRCIIKPVAEEGSLGITSESVVKGYDAMCQKHAQQCATYGGKWFTETFIEGREFNISVIETPTGMRVLPIAEIQFSLDGASPKMVTYDGKWTPEHPDYLGTTRHFPQTAADQPLLDKLQTLALQCWHGFALRGYARMDVRVDEAGNPWVLEINANPCISPDSGFVAAAAQADMTMEQVVQSIVESSIGEITHV